MSKIQRLSAVVTMDRGLYRPAVQSFANLRGLTYEEAHGKLSGLTTHTHPQPTDRGTYRAQASAPQIDLAF